MEIHLQSLLISTLNVKQLSASRNFCFTPWGELVPVEQESVWALSVCTLQQNLLLLPAIDPRTPGLLTRSVVTDHTIRAPF